jgi:hypothetical protein
MLCARERSSMLIYYYWGLVQLLRQLLEHSLGLASVYYAEEYLRLYHMNQSNVVPKPVLIELPCLFT